MAHPLGHCRNNNSLAWYVMVRILRVRVVHKWLHLLANNSRQSLMWVIENKRLLFKGNNERIAAVYYEMNGCAGLKHRSAAAAILGPQS